MARYYKLINGFMLNFYDLDLTEEEAFAQGYKTANEPPQDGKEIALSLLMKANITLRLNGLKFQYQLSRRNNDRYNAF